MRLSTACVLCVLLLITPMAAGQSHSASRREQSGPGGVVERRSHEGVVSLYTALIVLPRLEQRAAIRNLTPDTRAALWRHNITSFIEQKGELTMEQKAFLDEAYDAIQPSLFDNEGCDTPCSIDRHAFLEFYRVRAEAVFEADAIYRLFIRLGEEPIWPITPRRRTAAGIRSDAVRPDTLRECDCAGYFECWFAAEYCIAWECLPVRECGWWGTDGCWGGCA